MSEIRVVLVDDEPLLRHGLRMILEGAPGISVIGEAGNGKEGIELILGEEPDVVLMDIRMPVMDGIEATAQLHSLAGARDIPVVMLTAFDTDGLNSSGSKAVSITTGISRAPASECSCAVASMPSMTGMRISISTTSGSSARMSSTPSLPFPASPMTLMPGAPSKIMRRPWRSSGSSSTSTTRISLTVLPSSAGAASTRSFLPRRLPAAIRPQH